MRSIALLLLVCAAANAWHQGNGPAWDGLRITWDLNPFSKYAFTPMPRTVKDASAQGLQFVDDHCQAGSTNFLGVRFRYGNDVGLTLLYDKNGYIAGVQTCIPKGNYNPPAPMVNHPYVDDGDCWALTAYFVDPSIICTTGRTADQFAQSGTGDRLMIQNGSNPLTDSWRVPTIQTEMDKTLWHRGKCLWTMGLHYWYNVREDMSCSEWFPYFFLFNKGNLNAFGFTPPGDVSLPCPRYEHPSNFQAKSCCLEPFPQCFYEDPYYTHANTMHVYLIDSPRTTNFC